MVYAMPADAPHDRDALTLALQTPLATLPLSEHVLHMELAFDGPRVHVFATTQPGHLFCYSFAR